jgi:hypothetical protein
VAIGIGCAFDDLTAMPALRRWGLQRSQTFIIWILIGRLVLSPNLSAYLVLLSPEFRSSLHNRASVMQAESARISMIPGSVVCSIGLACYFAHKPLVFDEFIVGEYLATSKASQNEIGAKISDRKIRFELVDPQVDVGAESDHRIRWNSPRSSTEIPRPNSFHG